MAHAEGHIILSWTPSATDRVVGVYIGRRADLSDADWYAIEPDDGSWRDPDYSYPGTYYIGLEAYNSACGCDTYSPTISLLIPNKRPTLTLVRVSTRYHVSPFTGDPYTEVRVRFRVCDESARVRSLVRKTYRHVEDMPRTELLRSRWFDHRTPDDPRKCFPYRYVATEPWPQMIVLYRLAIRVKDSNGAWSLRTIRLNLDRRV